MKSGKTSNYFIDFGAMERAAALRELGSCYADVILQQVGIDRFDVLFGSSYKGVPIAVATALALEARGYDKAYSFNRKDEKEHGEGGIFIGRVPTEGDRVLIVDDVITDGGTKYEMIELIERNTQAEIVGVLVGVDRSEPGVVEEFKRRTKLPLWQITNFKRIQELFNVN